MELILSRPDRTTWQVDVACDGQHSHTFDVSTLLPGEAKGLPHALVDPVSYGKALYGALFPSESPARLALDAHPARLLLVALDEELDALPWEYACGPDGALASVCAFVRGLPQAQRAQPPTMLGEQVANPYSRVRKEAIERAAALLQAGEHREEVLVILDYLVHNDLMNGVREQAERVLSAARQPAPAPASGPPPDARHAFGVRCQNGHVNSFDRRKVCTDRGCRRSRMSW